MRAALKEDDRITLFEIHIPSGMLSDLQQRLQHTCWPYSMEGTGWDAGTDPRYLEELVGYWKRAHDGGSMKQHSTNLLTTEQK
jgi:hypothetical protein